MQIAPFMVVLAVGPLAVYFLVLGLLYLSRRVVLVTGERDFAALALSLSGMIAVGPVELFFPSDDAMVWFGLGVWIALAMLYLLSVVLIVLNLRPQWVVYGAMPDQVSEALLRAARMVDPQAQLRDGFVDLPAMNLYLRLDEAWHGAACRITGYPLKVANPQWRQVERLLRDELAHSGARGMWLGWWLVTGAMVLLIAMGTVVVRDPQAVATGFQSWLNH